MRSFPFLRPLAMLVAILCFTGCSSWRPAPGSPDPGQLPAGTDPVRVTVSDGSRLELHSPVLGPDSLYGLGPKPGSSGHAPRSRTSLSLATADIASLERREYDSMKTACFVLGLGAFVGALVLFGISASDSGPFGAGAHRTVPAPR